MQLEQHMSEQHGQASDTNDGQHMARQQRRAARAEKQAQLAARRQEVVRLKLNGHTFEEIARRLGYASRSGPMRAYRAALHEPGRDSREVARALEAERLDRLHRLWWPKALAGDEKAFDHILKIIGARIRLLGLSRPVRRRLVMTGRRGSPIEHKEVSVQPDWSLLTAEERAQLIDLFTRVTQRSAKIENPAKQ